MRRALRTLVSLILVAALLAIAPSALAAWIVAGTGDGFAQARQMPGGNEPIAVATVRSVTVTWTQSQFGDGTPVNGYLVKRYDASTGTEQPVGASCAGVITALTCTETAVPAGDWRYTVTPAHAAWRGAESTQSPAVTILPPALTLAPNSFTTLPTTMAGTLTNFIPGSTVTYRLDDPVSGPVLAGTTTPSVIPATGTAAVSVTIPIGTTNGAHTVYAVGDQGDVAGASFTVVGPTPTSVRLRNLAAPAGQPVRGDRVEVTFNQRLAVASLCSTWSGDATNKTIATDNVAWVGITNNAAPSGNDMLQLFTTAAACGGQIHFGTIDLGSPNFVTGDTYFGGAGANRTTVTWNATTFRFDITLGARAFGPAPGTVGSAVTATYTPDPAITNTFGTPVTGTASRTAVQF